MTPADARLLFPALERHTWLNAAASSPLARPVAEAMRAHVDEAMATGDLGYPSWATQKDAARARLARFIGAEANDVAFTSSTSMAMASMARRLLARGVTEVLTFDHEFPSTTVPLLHAGLTLRVVRRRTDGTFSLDDVEAALRPTTGAVAVSIVQFNSGFRVDVPALAALCRDRKLPLVLNAAQAIGQTQLQARTWGVAAIAGTFHKWVGAGYGTGLLYLHPEWQRDEAPWASWLSVPESLLWQVFPGARRADDSAGFTASGVELRHDAAGFDVGAGTWLAMRAISSALELHESLGHEVVAAHIAGLQRQLRAGLRRRGFTPNTPDDEAHGSGICVVPVRGEPLDAVRTLLRNDSIATTARGGGLRISTHFYNDESDVDRLLRALERHGIAPA
ncbi:MAG: aminotransferase class V-fold PLP-dependent enzyme [Archangium sp.]|nr:aminotransferase class V-fold PLP-dependent enzyme [Archangium sp.]